MRLAFILERTYVPYTKWFGKVTEPVAETVASFHARPNMVIHADRFAEVTEQAITSEHVRTWTKRVGSVSQWADATDVLDRPSLLPRLRSFYTPASGAAGVR